MTKTAAPAPYTLLVSKLGVHVDAIRCNTLIGARRKFNQLRMAGKVDQGAIFDDSPSATPLEYHGRA